MTAVVVVLAICNLAFNILYKPDLSPEAVAQIRNHKLLHSPAFLALHAVVLTLGFWGNPQDEGKEQCYWLRVVFYGMLMVDRLGKYWISCCLFVVRLQEPKNISLWASKTGNSGRTESVSCDLRRSGVSGQPLPTGGTTLHLPDILQRALNGFSVERNKPQHVPPQHLRSTSSEMIVDRRCLFTYCDPSATIWSLKDLNSGQVSQAQ